MIRTCLLILLAALPVTAAAQTVSAYTAQQTKCSEISDKVLAGSGEVESAENECKKALDMANNLPPTNVAERIDAYHGYGWTLLYAERFKDALAVWNTELDLALKTTPQDRKAIAGAYFDVGRATQGTGDLRQAEADYLKAELIYIDLYRAAATSELKAELKEKIRRNLLVRKYLAMVQNDTVKYNKIVKDIANLDRKP